MTESAIDSNPTSLRRGGVAIGLSLAAAARFDRWKSLALMALAASAALLARQAAAESIKIGLLKTSLNGPVYLAQERGYFAAEGLTVDSVFFDSAQPVAIATVSGAIQIGTAGLTAAFYSLAGQGALHIIASQGFEAPGFSAIAIVASNRAYEAGLKSFKNLPGHSVAISQIGSAPHYSLGLVAEKYGLDLKSMRLLPLQSVPNVLSAVVGGQADAGDLPVNPVIPAIQRGDVKLLGYGGDVMRWELGAVFTTTAMADGRRDTVERFLRAFRKGARDYHDAFSGPDEKRLDGPTAPQILDILVKYTAQPAEQVRTAIGYVDPEARVDVKDILHQIAWYKSQGMVKPEVDGDAIIDKRYVVPLPSP